MSQEHIAVKVLARRSGTVSEMISFLSDFESAYNTLYIFDILLSKLSQENYYWLRNEEYPKNNLVPPAYYLPIEFQPNWRSSILPEDALFLSKVSIQSPGFLEFVGALNPLLQLREFLNDRHKRKQDTEWRDEAEREKASLENELLRRKIISDDNGILKERIAILEKLGYSQEEIRQLIWTNISTPLIQLSKHQDSGLIDGAE